MPVKLAADLLIRGGISKEARGVRCRTAPGSLENPRFVQLTLAQCSNTPGLTPHRLAPEVNSVKRKREVGVKSCPLPSGAWKCPFCGGGRHWKTAERRQSITSASSGVICRGVLGWIHQDTCREAHKRFALPCGALETLKAARAGRATGIWMLPTFAAPNLQIPPGGEPSIRSPFRQAERRERVSLSLTPPNIVPGRSGKVAATSPFRGQNKLQVPAAPRRAFPSTQPSRESNAGTAERRFLLC